MKYPVKLYRLSAKIVGRNFLKHYVRPLLMPRAQVPYDAKRFFDSWYKLTPNTEFSDRITIAPNEGRLSAHYHYNAVENAIIEYFITRQSPQSQRVLDIGSGAGHWIDFYREVFDAQSVVGIEISAPAAEGLRRKYVNTHNVRILEKDISSPDIQLVEKFDIINAIGVMFHIVEDGAWRRAVRNLATHLNDSGVIVIGGQFGWITRNVQFHKTDQFSTWNETRPWGSDVIRVNKRIRSLRQWRECAAQAGLSVDMKIRPRQRKGISAPENNILLLRRST